MAASTHSRILILDFGAQYTQLIARRLRETHVYCEIHPHDVDDDFVRAVRAEGHRSVGRPEQRHRWRHAARARRGVDGWACRCSASATACRRWPRNWAAWSRRAMCASSATREVRARGHSALLRGIAGPHQCRRPRPARRLDEPRRQGHGAAAGFQGDRAATMRRPSPGWPTSRAASTRCSSTPRSRIPVRGPRSSRASRTRSAAAARTGTCPTTWPRRSRRSARRSAPRT